MFSAIASYFFGGTSEVNSNDERYIGILYLKSKKTGNWDCQFLEAKIKFHQKGKFQWDLCVERLENPPDEGDEVLITEPITSSIHARLQSGPDSPYGIAWKTQRGDWLMEFENEEETLDIMFEISRHIYQNFYSRDPPNDDAIHQLMQDIQTKPLTTNVHNYSPRKDAITPTQQQRLVTSPQKEETKQVFSNPNSPSKVTPKKPQYAPPTFTSQSAQFDGINSKEVKSEYGIFTVRSGKQQVVVGADIKISLFAGDADSYICLRTNKGECIHSWPISVDVNLQYDTANRSMVWIADMGQGMGDGRFEFAFSSFKAFSEFQKEVVAKVYAAKSHTKLTDEDLDWMVDGLSSKVIRMSIEDTEIDEDEPIIMEEKPSVFKSPTKATQMPSSNPGSSVKNSLLSVGRSLDRSYVIRGSNVGAFSPQKKGLKYETTFAIQSPNKKLPFSPSKSMIHRADQQLLLLNPDDSKKIYCMDLERGKVVEEWGTEGYKMNSILPETKDSQTKGTDCFIGVNNNGFILVDPRTNEKVVRTHQYSNSASTHFRCGATTGEGDLVVGSVKGDLRLFSRDTVAKGGGAIGSAPRAKTKLVGYGDPILSVDSTRDGSYVVATCETYLILCPVADKSGATGFSKSIRKTPILLQLTPEDVVIVGGKVKFTPAKFNVVAEETLIVTSTSNWVIMWNFADIATNIDHDGPLNVKYTKRWYPDQVIADDFTRNQEGEIVLTMPDDVRLCHFKT